MKPEQINSDLKFDIAEQIFEAPPSAIFVPPGRQRQHFDEKKLLDLCVKISEEGQHTPGLCFLNESGVHQLIFGERRLRACERLSLPYRYQLTLSPPDPYALAVLEFSENMAREDLTWREQVEAKASLHRMFQDRYGVARPGPGASGHSIRDTAAYLGQSFGNLSDDIELASFAAAIPEVADAKTKKDAKKLVDRLKEEVRRDVLLDRARTKASVCLPDQPSTPHSAPLEDLLIKFEPRILLGRLEDNLASAPPPSVVIFDPPWGVNYEQEGRINDAKRIYADSKEFFEENFPRWISLLYEKMTKDSHLYVFFGIVHHQFIYDTLEQAGFLVNRMPLLWYKQGTHHTRAPHLWPGRCYEPIAFAHKGERKLARRGLPDIIPTPPPTPTMKSTHPSAKHPQIYKELLERSCYPGDCVLDPMSGSGMFGVACEALSKTLALDWYQIELSEDYRNLSLFNLARGYDEIIGERIPSCPSIDFRTLEPGSQEWKDHWTTHPEQQAAMLEWRMTL